MAKLTKRDIVVAISNQTGMVQHQVFDVVQRTLDHITDSLANNVAVELRNFGVFQPRLTKPRVGRNPNEPGSSFVIPARATVDLQPTHIGGEVVLVCEAGDPQKPIVLGVMRAADPNHLAEEPGHVEVEADGERMFVSAKEQLVLRCGKAMITLTKAGKVLIEGTYVSSRSSGVHRIKGGSVQLN